MTDVRISRRYAKAVMDLAVENSVLENVHSDMLLIAQTCRENRALVVVLANPIVHGSKKSAILKEIFGGKVHDITEKLMVLLCNKHRVQFLFDISVEFHNAYNDFNGIEVASISTPFELDAVMRSQFIDIVKQISGKSKVELEEKIDATLIGGYVLKIRDRQIDDSIKSRLRMMRTKLTFA